MKGDKTIIRMGVPYCFKRIVREEAGKRDLSMFRYLELVALKKKKDKGADIEEDFFKF